MRLELTPVSDPTGQLPRKMVLERGRRSLGRAADCDWNLPEGLRSASKLHCLIERQGDMYQLIDRSSNGTWVDGQLIQDGAAVPLSDGSRIAIAGIELEVTIRGQPSMVTSDPTHDFTAVDEPMTISAILSDIAPGGQIAGGIIGAAETAELPDGPFARNPKPGGMSSSRHVEIGWSGPPDPGNFGKILPDDWDAEPASDFSDTLEHASATHVSILVAPVGRPKEPEASGMLGTLAIEAPDLALQSVAVEPVSSLMPLVSRLERELLAALAIVSPEDPEGEVFDTLHHGGVTEIEQRLANLVQGHGKLRLSLERLFSEAAQTFDPRMIEARVDARAGFSLGPLQELRYWRAYRAQFDANGGSRTVADILCAGHEQKGRADASRTTKRREEGRIRNEE